MTLFNTAPKVPEFVEGLQRVFAEGKVKPLASQSFPLKDAAAAHQALLDGRVFGKIALSPVE